MTNTDFQKRFREYKEKRKQVGNDSAERFDKNKDLPLKEVIHNFSNWISMQGYEEDTLKPYKNRLIRIFTDIGEIDMTLIEFIQENGGMENLPDIFENYKKFHLDELHGNNNKQKNKLSHNGIASLIKPINPFFKKFLGFQNFHLKHLSFIETDIDTITPKDVDDLIKHIGFRWNAKIEASVKQGKRMKYKQKLELELFVIECLKYTWMRTKAFTGHRLKIRDMKEMEQTGQLPLHIKKRTNNPEPYQIMTVPIRFIEAWSRYKKYRATDDWADNSPALVMVDSGKAINRRWVRDILVKRRREAGLPEALHAHNIRRCYFSYAVIKKGMNEKIARYQLGDKSSKIAIEHYIRPDVEMRKKAINAVYQDDEVKTDNKGTQPHDKYQIKHRQNSGNEADFYPRVQPEKIANKMTYHQEGDMAYA